MVVMSFTVPAGANVGIVTGAVLVLLDAVAPEDEEEVDVDELDAPVEKPGIE
jgi:hypothetical protein